jgi:hypothetical protein
MSYLDFLAEWYNLVFLAAGALALVVAAGNRLRGRSSLALPAGLLVAAVTGLTWNGAIHDLGGGSPAPRFPLVFVVAAAVGVLGGRTLALVRDRFFRPITAVCFNRPGYEGVEARVVSRDAGPEPGSGRAQWQDTDGVLNIVHIQRAESYLAIPLPRRAVRRRDAGTV